MLSVRLVVRSIMRQRGRDGANGFGFLRDAADGNRNDVNDRLRRLAAKHAANDNNNVPVETFTRPEVRRTAAPFADENGVLYAYRVARPQAPRLAPQPMKDGDSDDDGTFLVTNGVGHGWQGTPVRMPREAPPSSTQSQWPDSRTALQDKERSAAPWRITPTMEHARAAFDRPPIRSGRPSLSVTELRSLARQDVARANGVDYGAEPSTVAQVWQSALSDMHVDALVARAGRSVRADGSPSLLLMIFIALPILFVLSWITS
jgi:hypothetical protein